MLVDFTSLFDHTIIYSTEDGTVVVSLTKIKMYFLSMNIFCTKFEHSSVNHDSMHVFADGYLNFHDIFPHSSNYKATYFL